MKQPGNEGAIPTSPSSGPAERRGVRRERGASTGSGSDTLPLSHRRIESGKRAQPPPLRVPSPLRDAQSYFSGKAEAYRRSTSHGSRSDLDRMIAWLAPRPGARALDVATGGGHTALALAEAACDTLATDATPAMLAGWPPLPRAVCDALRLPFTRGSFDLVTSRIAPHHFPDIALFCQEVARVLRPGGALYVFDLTTPDDAAIAARIDHVERLRDPSHGHSWSATEWRTALARAGLRPERVEESSSTFDIEPWIARAQMPADREAELRRILAEEDLGGYGVTREGKMRVLRVELLARA